MKPMMTILEAADLDISFDNRYEVLQKLSRKHIVMFALKCAKLVQPLTRNNKKADRAIAIAEKWLGGETITQECMKNIPQYEHDPHTITNSYTASYGTCWSAYYADYRSDHYSIQCAANAAHYATSYAAYNNKDIEPEIVEYLRFLVREEVEGNALLKLMI